MYLAVYTDNHKKSRILTVKKNPLEVNQRIFTLEKGKASLKDFRKWQFSKLQDL